MERNAFFDNAKIALIFLVVFGHMMQPFISGSHNLTTLYMWVYTFHMPAFIFLSGFFAKGSGNKTYILKLAKKLLLPYVIFQLVYTIFYYFIGKDSWQTSLFDPQWSLWFLFSLFSWHMLLYWFKKVPPLLGIAIAVEIGLLVGYFGEIGQTFSLSRTFVFFPFFLAGYWLKEEHVMMLKTKVARIISLIVMVSVAGLVYIAPHINSGWLLASKSYSDLGMPEYGGITRLVVYMTSALMAMSILVWIPKQKMWLTYLGERTLYVYLLHGFFIQSFRQFDLFKVDGVLDLLGLAVLAASIVLVLSSRPIKFVSQPFIEGKILNIKNIFRRKQLKEN